MPSRWSPHPRYRIYADWNSYRVVLEHLLCTPRDAPDAGCRLETEICRRFNVNAACCVPMARTGLFFALQELIRPGQKVILSPLTIIDVVNMVVLAGGIPVFADVRPHSCSIGPDEVKSLIDDNTGAVLMTHLHRESAGAHEILEICRPRGVPLIEDTAQAFGALENGCRLGTIGDLGIYSFGFFKNINAWGGGILVSHDKSLIERIRRRIENLPIVSRWRLLGIVTRGLITDLATWPPFFAMVTYPILRRTILRGATALSKRLDPERNARRLLKMPHAFLQQMTAAQARLALEQLDRVDTDSQVRITKAQMYERVLNRIDALVVPKFNGFSNTFSCYPIQYVRREALLNFAIRHKRDFAAQYLRNCADLQEFREFYRDCPNARKAARELILLPTHPAYPDSEIKKNVDVISQFFHQLRTV